jgi:hypothetical protein
MFSINNQLRGLFCDPANNAVPLPRAIVQKSAKAARGATLGGSLPTVRRVHARRSPSLLEDLPVAKTPDADRVRGGSEGEQDGEHREQLARVAVCPKHAEEAFDRPIDDRELAKLLHELRHEAGRPPGAADRAHGQDEQRAHAVRRRGRGRERGEQHAEGNAGTCRSQTDEE